MADFELGNGATNGQVEPRILVESNTYWEDTAPGLTEDEEVRRADKTQEQRKKKMRKPSAANAAKVECCTGRVPAAEGTAVSLVEQGEAENRIREVRQEWGRMIRKLDLAATELAQGVRKAEEARRETEKIRDSLASEIVRLERRAEDSPEGEETQASQAGHDEEGWSAERSRKEGPPHEEPMVETALLELYMSEPMFRARVIARLVKRLQP